MRSTKGTGESGSVQPDGVLGEAQALEHLAETAHELLNCETPDDVYDAICDFMTRLCPGAVIAVNEITPDIGFFITRRIVGVEATLLARAASLIGFSFVGKKWPIPADFRGEVLSGTLSRIEGGFAGLASSEIPAALSETLTKLAGIHDVFTAGITDREHVLGNFAIVTRTPDVVLPTVVIETFARQCYSALVRISKTDDLAAAAERGRLLIDSMVEGLSVHEIILDDRGTPCDYRFLEVNAAFETLTGMRAADVVGRTIAEIHPGVESFLIERYGAVASTGVPVRFETYSPVLGKHFRIVAYSPQPGQFATIFSDITERVEREKAAERAQLLLSSSLESQKGTLLFSIDAEYKYLYFNQAHVEAMRHAYGQEIALGECILDHITSEEDRAAAKQNYDRALGGESHSNVREFGDVEVSAYESFFNPIIDDEGIIIGATGMARDVSERIKEEQTRRQSEERFAALFTQAPLGYQSLDEDGRFIEVNEAWLQTLGYAREEVIGAWFGDFLAPEYVDAFRERFPIFKSRGAIHSEFQMMHKDGNRHFIAFDGRIGFNPDGSFRQTHCILADITERKRAEETILRLNAELEQRVQERTEELTAANEELLETNSQLDEATRAKSDFLASMSHELRTPLNSIIGFSDLLGKGMVGELEPEQAKQISMINASGRHLLSLVDDILDLSKIESGQTEAVFERCEITPLVSSVLEMVRPLADAKGIGLKSSVDADVVAFESDSRFVSQILTNLLGNAVKFTESGTVSLRVSADDDAVQFDVMDTGRGIPATDIPRIMERFYQATPQLEAKHEGAGLGLAISSRLAEMLGATLVVQSEFGVGSTFTLRIPRRFVPDVLAE